MVNELDGVQTARSPASISSRFELINLRAIYGAAVNRIYSNRECRKEF
jgi:hypothetical protein